MYRLRKMVRVSVYMTDRSIFFDDSHQKEVDQLQSPARTFMWIVLRIEGAKRVESEGGGTSRAAAKTAKLMPRYYQEL